MTLAFPKPEPRARMKARKHRGIAKVRKATRVALFASWDGQQAESMGLGEDRPCDGECGRVATAMHHVVLRSKGGKDEGDNVAALCPFCHADTHAKLLRWSRENGKLTAHQIYTRTR